MGVKQPTVHAERKNSMNPLLLPSQLVKPFSIAMEIKIQTRPEWHNISQQLA